MALIWVAAACALLVLAARWERAAPALCAGAVAAACLGGTTLPDIDFRLPFGHRSALTHSLIPVLVALARRRWWPVAAGLALGVGLHLGADAFPNALRGYALVKVPLAGALSPGLSRLWLGSQALGGLGLGAWLSDSRRRTGRRSASRPRRSRTGRCGRRPDCCCRRSGGCWHPGSAQRRNCRSRPRWRARRAESRRQAPR